MVNSFASLSTIDADCYGGQKNKRESVCLIRLYIHFKLATQIILD